MSLTPLPQAPGENGGRTSVGGPVAHSKRSRWRAASLIAVHVAVAVHILHWVISGRTFTPLEPSEAMMTLEKGAVNAGFLLFVLLIAATLVFGRFFCGWACHLVAYQDLCGWMLRKMGLRPKPFRSRLLVFVPLLAALYMFVWPQVLRLWQGRPAPTFAYHLTTDEFWATFPGLGISILTFAVCGFGIVWLLGNKGFCTYGCPYGAFFYHADHVAPGKIRVTDACDGCGHCTAACTSNVRVHEEVAAHGMVVDAGCMKCMDCVDVCPKDALYFGFGVPTVAKGKPKKPRARRAFDFTLAEDLLLAAVFLACLYAFRSLYDAVPFLLALGLSAVASVLILTGMRTLYAPNVRLQRFQLRAHGRLAGAGRGYLAFTGVLVALIAHSGLVQYHTRQGAAEHARAVELFDRGLGEDARRVSAQALKDLHWASSNGWVPVGRVEAMIGNLEGRLDRPGLALEHLERAAALQPESAEIRRALAKTLMALDRPRDAEKALREALKVEPASDPARADLAALLVTLGEPEDAAELWLELARRHPEDPGSRISAAFALGAAGRAAEAERMAREAVALDAGSAPAHHMLALILAEQGSTRAAIAEAETAARLAPDLPEAQVVLARLYLEADDPSRAVACAERAKTLRPTDPETLAVWALAHDAAGSIDQAVRDELGKAPSDDAAAYAAAFLYQQRGDRASVQTLMRNLSRSHPDWPSP